MSLFFVTEDYPDGTKITSGTPERIMQDKRESLALAKEGRLVEQGKTVIGYWIENGAGEPVAVHGNVPDRILGPWQERLQAQYGVDNN